MGHMTNSLSSKQFDRNNIKVRFLTIKMDTAPQSFHGPKIRENLS